MSSPFPGMDPYLEDHEIWPGFHHRLAIELSDQLNPHIAPKYYADIEIASVPEEISIGRARPIRPDVSVFEPKNPTLLSLNIKTPEARTVTQAPVRRLSPLTMTRKLLGVRVYETDTSALVTAIEILSPYNKRAGDGLGKYRRKRRELLRSATHFIELDLLRKGTRPGTEVNTPPLESEYVLLVNRSSAQRVSEIWPVSLHEVLPVLPVPLLEPDPDVFLDVQAAVQTVYQHAGYALRIDYRQSMPPPDLRPAMAKWVQELLAERA